MENSEVSKNTNLINILKGLGIALITNFIFLLILAIILTYTNVSESVINPTIIIITAISILIGSSISNMKIKKNGLINGGVIGRHIYNIIIPIFKYI